MLLIIVFLSGASAQSFQSNNSGIISDKLDAEIIPSFFQVIVEDLPSQIDNSFGLEKICFHIKHRRPTDLKIELLSPQGTSVWLSNRNGLNNRYGYLNTCVVQNGFNGPIHKPERNFEGEYSAEGRLDFFNNGQNPNGVWILIVTDLNKDVVGKLEDITITFGSNPAQLTKSPCNKVNSIDCVSSLSNNNLLPDLIISKKLSERNIQYFDADHKEYPNQLRFAAAMANVGEGPLEIITTNNWYCNDSIVNEKSICKDGSFPTNNVQQVIYSKSNKDTLNSQYIKSGTMYFDDSPGHNHYHVKNWADFKLLKKRWWTRNPQKWKIIASSSKVSYCLFDNKICSKENNYCQDNDTVFSQSNLINYGLGRYVSCNSRVQGISVGGIDYYGMYYEGQSIEVPEEIKKGNYYLYIEVDPQNEYQELNENNNSILIPIKIKPSI